MRRKQDLVELRWLRCQLASSMFWANLSSQKFGLEKQPQNISKTQTDRSAEPKQANKQEFQPKRATAEGNARTHGHGDKTSKTIGGEAEKSSLAEQKHSRRSPWEVGLQTQKMFSTTTCKEKSAANELHICIVEVITMIKSTTTSAFNGSESSRFIKLVVIFTQRHFVTYLPP